jgi:hypothetical protein
VHSNSSRHPGKLTALALAFPVIAGCSSTLAATSSAPPSATSSATSSTASPATSPASPASAASKKASDSPAPLAFSGTYQVKTVVTATSGDYGESIGSVEYFTWQAVPDCSGQSCVIRVTSSSGSHTTFTYHDGAFDGIGHGSADCVNGLTGEPTGQNDPSTLRDTLVPATSASPAQSLSGVVHLSMPTGCGGISGTGTFSYKLTRIGNGPASSSVT